MIRPLTVAALALALDLLLAGCNKPAPGQSEAPVPVLTGTISDAMIPLDRVTSQPPLDPRAGREEDDGQGQGPAAEATDAPAAGPVPVATGAAAAAPARADGAAE